MSPLSAPATATKPTTAACPRCQKPMIDPQGLGWCKACGYCRSLEESQANPELTAMAAPAPLNHLTATSSAVGDIPSWFWVTLIGVILIVGATWAGGHYLKLTPLDRALLASAQIIIGMTLQFIGQIIGLIRIAPEVGTLGFKDALFPVRLYAEAFKRLPRNRHTIYLGAWGLAAIIAANVFIGGLDHWTTYLPGKNKNKVIPVQKAK